MDSPQELLDQIHASGVFGLNERDYPTTEARAQQAKQIRPRLRDVQARVQAAQKAVRSQKGPAAARHLLPYEYLNEMLDKLESSLRGFITDPTVKIPYYGPLFFGDPQQGEWYIGTPRQAQIWKLERQNAAISQALSRIQAAIDDNVRQLKATRRKMLLNDGLRRGVAFAVVGGLLVAAGIGAALIVQTALTLLVSGVGLPLFGVGIRGIVRWNRIRKQLQAKDQALRAQRRKLERQQQALAERQPQIASQLKRLQGS